jgi:hypothetical protein
VWPLAPSPAWTLVTPYCKRTRPGRGTNTKAAGFLPLSRPPPAAFPSPLRARPRADPSGLGHAETFHSSAQGPPGLETPTPGDSHFWASLMNIKEEFLRCGRFRVGDGQATRFWDDRWILDRPFKVFFLNLFNIMHKKNVLVKDVMNGNLPNLSFGRAIVGGEAG